MLWRSSVRYSGSFPLFGMIDKIMVRLGGVRSGYVRYGGVRTGGVMRGLARYSRVKILLFGIIDIFLVRRGQVWLGRVL